jgi:hypothetical protein
MISGAKALLLIACCVAFTGAAADSPGWDIKRLMHDLGEVKTAKGRFVERKYVAILTAPLEFSGTLLYVAPDRLEKHTLKPRSESLLLERDELVIQSENPDRRRALKLRNYPVVQVFVESVRSTLAGDLALLTRFFEIALQGDEHSWRLLLKPNDPKMQEVMSEIRISGNGSWINTIEFLEAGGDRSVMSITRDEP